MPKISCNKVTNAQLGAWVGVVPSTIQAWRKKKEPGQLLEIHQKRIKRLTQAENLPKIPSEVVELLEEAYEKAGHPCSHVTGRDFTDEDRLHRHPLKRSKRAN